MTRLTLGKLKHRSSGIAQAVGIPACDQRFTDLANWAQESLANDGKWWGTIVKLRVCVTANCIVWPREVKTVEAFNLLSYSLPVRNKWFEFQEYVAAPKLADCSCVSQYLIDRDMTCQHTDFSAPSYIRLYPRSSTDVGKQILLQGKDPNGVTIRSQNDAGEWIDGEYVTLAYPYSTSTSIFLQPGLEGSQKPVTNGDVIVMAVNYATLEETQIAIWQPSEETPYYRRSYLTKYATQCSGDSSDCGDGCSLPTTNCTGPTADVIIRRECLPVSVDSDWMFLGEPNAYLHEMRRRKHILANQYDMAAAEHKLALDALNSELKAYSPPTQVQVNAEIFGSAKFSSVIGGFI